MLLILFKPIYKSLFTTNRFNEKVFDCILIVTDLVGNTTDELFSTTNLVKNSK